MPPALVGGSWSAAVSISPLLAQPRMVPRFCPAMPPALVVPETAAALVQPSMVPLSPLRPAMPPTSSAPVTSPRAAQFRMTPWFSPARRPAWPAVPPGETVPSTVRPSTTAVSVRVRKRPIREPFPVRERPRMVWPLPEKVPWKMGTPVKPLPVRSMSAVRATVRPWDQVSLVQLWAKARKASRLSMTRSGPAARAGRTWAERRSPASSRAANRLNCLMSGPPGSGRAPGICSR